MIILVANVRDFFGVLTIVVVCIGGARTKQRNITNRRVIQFTRTKKLIFVSMVGTVTIYVLIVVKR